MADVLGKVIRKMGPKKVKEMDTAAKRAAGSPGYDDDTMEAIKELERKEKSRTLTPAEERELDRLNRKMVRQSSAERAENMPKSEKAQRLTEKQKKEMQESLNFKKGGMPTKMAYGGMAKTKMAVGGMPMGPDGKPTFVGDGKGKMAMGGMAKKYNKGGMGTKANCGASVKPSGGSRNK